ncbi:hypothetical protein BT96DRAFT_942286 [Gymnopus androsaceus JB14]|uniref:Uncharacterized protein n=1 Tax=Gymnopus androsaceus JB14 TaxID=1447944 RepID=A0A6A4HF49_9AGAR|nr:hypothetical protein BT96DRAFT_942286 [Gymnopus androsaceus JB14]
MPRLRTESTIKKSKRTDEQQAKVTQGKRIGYSCWNRYKNKTMYNAVNSARMASKRAKLEGKAKDEAKARQREASKKSYLKEHMKKHGLDAIWWYKMRKGACWVGIDNTADDEDVLAVF